MYIPVRDVPVARLNPSDCRLRRGRLGALARWRLDFTANIIILYIHYMFNICIHLYQARPSRG